MGRIEKWVDSKILSFRNRRCTAARLVLLVACWIAIGIVIGTAI